MTATVGPGPDSVSATGHEYLAGPYKGAPFDLVAITPAVSGPFDLGVVVLRQGLYVDPHTAQATVKSDPLPTVIDGVPLDVRSVTVNIDGVGGDDHFIFNPTSCAPLAVTGSLVSTSATIAAISSPFQASGCASLKFKPGFVVSTEGKASKAAGASLDATLTYPVCPAGHLCEHQVGQGGPAQAAPRPPDDAAESLFRRDIRSKPRELSCAIGRGQRQGASRRS